MTSAAALPRDPVWRGRGDRTIRARGRAKAVDDRELALIRSFALREVHPDEVRVYEARVANNRIDRDQERFSEEILADFAETLVGKSVCIAHQWGPPGVGRVHRAELVEEDGTLWLRAAFFIPVLGNEKLLNDLDLGVVTYVSIGFAAPTCSSRSSEPPRPAVSSRPHEHGPRYRFWRRAGLPRFRGRGCGARPSGPWAARGCRS